MERHAKANEREGGKEGAKEGLEWQKLALSKQAGLVSRSKGWTGRVGGPYAGTATTMGPFVLCSVFLITPRARARADTPPNPLRSRKDRESGLCKDDGEGKKHASLMHRDHPPPLSTPVVTLFFSFSSRKHGALTVITLASDSVKGSARTPLVSGLRRLRGFVWFLRQFCVYATQARCDTRVRYFCLPRQSKERMGIPWTFRISR